MIYFWTPWEADMPSKTPKQARTMQAAARNPKFASKMGIPQKVARDFVKADTGKSVKPPNRPQNRGGR